MKKIWNEWLKGAVTIYCMLYTMLTLINSIGYLAMGIYEDPSGNWHEIDRAIVMFIGVSAYVLATKLPVKNLIVRAIAVYVPTLLLVYGYIWLSGLREPLAASAYRDITINYTGLFLIIFLVVAIREIVKKKTIKS